MNATIISAFNKTPEMVKNKNYEECAIRFVRSIRENGGKCKNIPIKFWIDGNLMPSNITIKRLLDYNCSITLGKLKIPQPSKGGSWSSKLQALDECKIDTKYGIWMDTDMYITRGFTGLLECNSDVKMTPVSLVHNFGASDNENKMWDKYYDYFKLKRPDTKIKTHVDKKLGNFYFTSSLIMFKSDLDFGKKYYKFAKRLYDSDLPHNEKRYVQTVLPLMIVKYGWTYETVPIQFCYLYHLNNYTLGDHKLPPAIIHYCDNRITEIPDDKWNV